ncbi:MAG: PAS domain S-box protein [Desulfitobacterium hafniense]|nr:PAS domain S-box protein [Desulfitobacterium hafniense]
MEFKSKVGTPKRFTLIIVTVMLFEAITIFVHTDSIQASIFHSLLVPVWLVPTLYIFGYLPVVQQLRFNKEVQKNLVLMNVELKNETDKLNSRLRSLMNLFNEEHLEALRLSEQKYKTLMNSLNVGISVISPDMKVITVNEKIKEWHPKVDFTTNPYCYTVFQGSEKPRICDSCPTIKALKDGQVHKEIKHVELNGVPLVYRVVASPIKNENGEVCAVTKLVEDITEQLNASEQIKNLNRELEQQLAKQKLELQAVEGRYRKLVQNSSDGVLVFDPLSRQIQDGNHQVLAILGYTLEEITQLRICDLTLRNSLDKIDYLTVLPDEEKTLRETCQYRCKDGSLVDVETSISLIHQNHSRICIVNVRNIAERIVAEKALQESYEDLKRTLKETVNALVSLTEKRDPYTAGHQHRVAELAVLIAGKMGFSNNEIEQIKIAATLHDIGKAYVPSDILNKPGILSEMEMGIIKSHPEVGHEILNQIPFELPVGEIVRQHHERLNGSGYPRQLIGEEIFIEARIIAVADVVEAITSHRPYRPARGLKQAIEELKNNSGLLYDEVVVQAFLQLAEQEPNKLRFLGQNLHKSA